MRAGSPPHICQRVRQSTVPCQLPPRHQLVDETLARRSPRNGWRGLSGRLRSLAAVSRFQPGLAFVRPDRLARFGGLLYLGLRSGWDRATSSEGSSSVATASTATLPLAGRSACSLSVEPTITAARSASSPGSAAQVPLRASRRVPYAPPGTSFPPAYAHDAAPRL